MGISGESFQKINLRHHDKIASSAILLPSKKKPIDLETVVGYIGKYLRPYFARERTFFSTKQAKNTRILAVGQNSRTLITWAKRVMPLASYVGQVDIALLSRKEGDI